MTFGIYLKNKRNEKKISLRDFSDAVGISLVYASNLESGVRSAPSQKILSKIVKVLCLNEKEREKFFDLAAQSKNTPSIAIDLANYINRNSSARATMRKAKKLNACKADWDYFSEYLTEKYG